VRHKILDVNFRILDVNVGSWRN